MSFLAKLFKRDKAQGTTRGTGDMRDTPIDNPLDFREDGSIRPGDPAWASMMETLNSGKATISRQQKDGTWTVEEVD